MRSVPGFITLISLIKDCQSKHRLGFSLSFRKIYVPFIRFLAELGFIAGFAVKSNRLFVFVRYFPNGVPLLQYIEKPAFSDRRISLKLKFSYPVSRPFKFTIVSTSKGLLLHSSACFLKIGGRILFRFL